MCTNKGVISDSFHPFLQSIKSDNLSRSIRRRNIIFIIQIDFVSIHLFEYKFNKRTSLIEISY